ncbi:hypothetical protein M8818_000434 [Zalaria obscura]|uniref:Uncharacterized protein n=1 Tax=Zalaria obscura TaxID=2024903 RepID=A0ACC3SNS2_9PEZI
MSVKRSHTSQTATAATHAAQAPSPKRTRLASSQHQDRSGDTVGDNGPDDGGSESEGESSSSVSATSSSADSSSGASDASENEGIEDLASVINVSGLKKPQMQLPASSSHDLRSRLSSFLPQLAAANAELEQLAQNGGLEGKRFEDVDEGAEGGYIEMELGLGVLEEKREGGEYGDDADEEDEEGEDEDDHLGRLMGQVRKGQNLGIQEVDGK